MSSSFYPPVSVLVTTYNHEKFLGECLQSILDQDYPGPLKVFVGEDGSKDNTALVLKEFSDKFPDKIVPIFREKNIGGHANFLDVLKTCDAEWIAWLEGDDYWLDKSKLTKQMEALSQHPQCSVCFGKAKSLDVSNIGFAKDNIYEPDFFSRIYTRDDLLRRNMIPTCTVVFKKNAVWPLPEWYSNWHLGDWTLYLEALKHGNAVFIDEVLSVYRIHAGGVWSHVNAAVKLEKQEKLIRFLIPLETSHEAKKNLYFNLFTQQAALTIVYLKQKKLSPAFHKLVDVLGTFFKAKWTIKGIGTYLKKFISLTKNLDRN